MTTYQGACHCGAVKFTITTEQPVTSGLRCTCSVCARKGALMSTQVFDRDELGIELSGDNLSLYQFGSKTAKHYFCKHCGIYPFHETARVPGKYRVNLGCIDELHTVSMPFEVFDGRNLL